MESTRTRRSNTFILVALALVATARAQLTTSLFMPNAEMENFMWAGSVIGACSDSTTYALRCSATPVQPPTNALQRSQKAAYTQAVAAICDPNAPAITVTEGPSGFYQSTETAFSGTTTLGAVSCALSGTTAAVCTRTLEAILGKQSATSTTPMTWTAGIQVPFIDVTVTGGVTKLAKATGNVCTSGAGIQHIPLAFAAMAFAAGVCAVLAL